MVKYHRTLKALRRLHDIGERAKELIHLKLETIREESQQQAGKLLDKFNNHIEDLKTGNARED